MPHATVATVATGKENRIAERILDAAFKVHTTLGPGLLESVYEVILAHELRKGGLHVERQKPISIIYGGIKFDEGFRADHGRRPRHRRIEIRLGVEPNSRQASPDPTPPNECSAWPVDQLRRRTLEERNKARCQRAAEGTRRNRPLRIIPLREAFCP